MAIQTAKALAADLHSGRRDPVDVVAEVFDRIETTGDPALFIRQTRTRAEAEARAARERLKAGLPASPLDGVPMAWKDLFDLKGTVTTAGSAVLRNAPPAQNGLSLYPVAPCRVLDTRQGSGPSSSISTRYGFEISLPAIARRSLLSFMSEMRPSTGIW